MTNRHTNLSIIEAVETLSQIADLEIDRNVGVAKRHEVTLDNEQIMYKTVHWLQDQDGSTSIPLVREIFRVILQYLKQFYRKEYGYVTDPKTVEGIKTIMVLVGEAAKKLDKYTSLFRLAHATSVTDLKEYKQLQEFYLSKIARRIDEGVLGRWILGLSLGHPVKEKIKPIKLKAKQPIEKAFSPDIKHLFVDLETVKKDTEYELFFIRKEDGTRFFNPRLLRNIKLVCDFGDYFGEQVRVDPLLQVKQWFDRVLHLSAKDLIKSLGEKLNYFFRSIRKVRDHEVVEAMNKSLMALLMSANNHNLLRHSPPKSCSDYFIDFQFFLREALQTRTYQKWLAYPPKPSNTMANDLLNLIHSTCRALYTNLKGMEEMISIIHVMIQDASKETSSEHHQIANQSDLLWNRLAFQYMALTKLIKKHANGPLFKILEILEEQPLHVFDQLLQGNVPNRQFDLTYENQKIRCLRFASPVYQEFINKAVVLEEFKAFLRDYHQSEPLQKHLLINLQDRTSWLEHARCAALEELQNHPDIKDSIVVFTLAIDTDFYHQLAPYHQNNHADVFIEQLKEHLKGEGSGFFYPDSVNKGELFRFIDQAVGVIHRLFFSNKNVLSRENRLDFIEIFYILFQLKLIEIVKPDSFSATCKDGVDIGPVANAEMYIFLKMLNQTDWSENEYDAINFMLYAPAILFRERVLLSERFNRMINAVRTLESAQQEMEIKEPLKKLYKTAILDSGVTL